MNKSSVEVAATIRSLLLSCAFTFIFLFSQAFAQAAPDGANAGGGAQPDEQSEFQSFVASSVGKLLPLYGHNLFVNAPNTFSPLDNIPVTPDYLIGPGDELVIRGWGQVDFDLSLTVDRNGAIYLPKVGNVNVAGIRYEALHGYLKNAIGRIFHNFELNVSLGKLRSIQVFVVGQAKRPGAYTVSSLSTLVNTLFASGGPSLRGSLRNIQVKRNGGVVSELDMYDFLLKGDKTKDISLLPGDVIYIPPVGPLSAISGSINNPAIYELKKGANTLAGLIDLAGGLTTTAGGDKVRVERIENRKMRKVEEFSLDQAGQRRLLKDGDVVQVEVISGQFGNAVTLRGNVANPGRYPWRDGMRVKDLIPDIDALIVPEYWATQNRSSRMNINSEKRLHTEIKRNENEINWDYALIERLNKDDLNTSLIHFNLGKALAVGDEENNLSLQQGDVITIFSKEDIQVPAAKRSVYVTLEGEFNQAGVYKVKPGETLRQLVERAGGLTSNAYLFASEFNRESVRVSQQRKLEEMVDRMAEDIERNLAAKSQAALSKEDVDAAKAQAVGQRALLERMRRAKATGRVVLAKSKDKMKSQAIPDLVLEDGDRFVVPQHASTVSVMGMVYNENAFMHETGKRVSDYLDLAGGPTRDADESRIYILRADGSVLSKQSTGSLFGSLNGQALMPGDALVVPELLDKLSLTRELKDWAQIFYQFALGVGAINLLRM
ncbi:MAG: SLBB domain-containing protein [Gallionella sp.]|jgi:protein involved in polysaccharide export with SLBB domain|nr:SLBB domain-containing protein [Gallionella sp.]MCK9353563.1 SLBB domain-containing protein [Gallionella sp.]